VNDKTQFPLAAEHFCEVNYDRTSDDSMTGIVAINDAIQLLNETATRVAGGSMSVWKVVDHARRHLEKRIETCIH
jgi:hypothetical protein